MVIALTVIGIACILYGFIVMSLASGTWFFAFWLVLGALLLGGAWALHAGWYDALPVVGRRALGTVAVVLMAGFLVAQGFIAKDFNDEGEEALDCIVVLGAQVRESGPSLVLRYRLDKACDYLARNPQTRCIVSGGQGANEASSEASVMYEYLVTRGIDPDRIALEDRSRNTSENIGFSKQLLDAENDRVGIVTNNFHVFRGVAVARKAGYRHVVGIAADSSAFFLPNNLVRESLGVAKDFLVGNL